MENLKIYNAVRKVPQEAQKAIGGGRLKGMTDINPMWRIKTLTEQFGPVGFGWYYKITDKRLEKSEQTQEIAAFIEIELYVKVGNEWSMPIVGTGGSSFVVKESKGLYASDECFKMALTDAISVACKALGFGADVYWNKDRTKYDQTQENGAQSDKNQNTTPNTNQPQKVNAEQLNALYALAKTKGRTEQEVKDACMTFAKIQTIEQMTIAQYNAVVKKYEGMPNVE